MPVRSARSVAVPAAALLAVTLLGGCGGDRPTAVKPEAAVATSPAAAPPAAGAPPAADLSATDAEEYTAEECPVGANTKRFAKTRFALHAGLALGAFYRYIYKPLQSGGFKAGAEKRKRTFAKAAVAGLFTLHELRVARRFALANPTLCKGVKTVTDSFDNLTNKLKSGTATEADLQASKNSFDSLRQNATKNGYNFNEKTPVVPGAG
ncbi:hypothetical protein GCM10022252_17570 [Streptosporangium oxazolinicum]|uniref:Uncharacterized protein n=1 Tax=Streptosporangium oxazolinicum TaxID=909287 RepID=A0ABP8AM07_9ACTN